MNTDKADRVFSIFIKKGIFFLFDSFRFQDSKNIINKIICNIKTIYRIDDKTTLTSVTFSTNEYEKNISELSTTAIDLSHAINEFRKEHGLDDEITIHSVEDQLQITEKDTCGIY